LPERGVNPVRKNGALTLPFCKESKSISIISAKWWGFNRVKGLNEDDFPREDGQMKEYKYEERTVGNILENKKT
jgi:hypothetical protein